MDQAGICHLLNELVAVMTSSAAAVDVVTGCLQRECQARPGLQLTLKEWLLLVVAVGSVPLAAETCLRALVFANIQARRLSLPRLKKLVQNAHSIVHACTNRGIMFACLELADIFGSCRTVWESGLSAEEERGLTTFAAKYFIIKALGIARASPADLATGLDRIAAAILADAWLPVVVTAIFNDRAAILEYCSGPLDPSVAVASAFESPRFVLAGGDNAHVVRHAAGDGPGGVDDVPANGNRIMFTTARGLAFRAAFRLFDAIATRFHSKDTYEWLAVLATLPVVFTLAHGFAVLGFLQEVEGSALAVGATKEQIEGISARVWVVRAFLSSMGVVAVSGEQDAAEPAQKRHRPRGPVV